MYTFIMFSIDALFKEQFTYTQLFNFTEFTFFTNRGIMTTIALAFAVVSTSSILLSLINEHNLARDHSFTLGFLHFVVVSLVNLDFPTSYAWWIALIVGGLALDGVCEFAIYQINTMPYKSHMAGDQKRKKLKKQAATPRPPKQELRPRVSAEALREGKEDAIRPSPKRTRSSPNASIEASFGDEKITISEAMASWKEPEKNPKVLELAASESKSPRKGFHQRSQSHNTSHSSIKLDPPSAFDPQSDILVDIQQLHTQRRSLSMISPSQENQLVDIDQVTFSISPSKQKQQQRPADEFF